LTELAVLLVMMVVIVLLLLLFGLILLLDLDLGLLLPVLLMLNKFPLILENGFDLAESVRNYWEIFFKKYKIKTNQSMMLVFVNLLITMKFSKDFFHCTKDGFVQKI
jgi:hypothetical protein